MRKSEKERKEWPFTRQSSDQVEERPTVDRRAGAPDLAPPEVIAVSFGFSWCHFRWCRDIVRDTLAAEGHRATAIRSASDSS